MESMKIPLLDLQRQYKQLKDELEPVMLETLASGGYIQGPRVMHLEQSLCDYLGVRHAVTVGNGTDALVIVLKAMGIGAGDEVITTPFTFFATAESIAAVGAVPVFCDVCEDTFNLDPEKLEEKITKKTKAIMPVHIFGQPADMAEIDAVAKKYGLRVIEDACQAIGAEYKGEKIGTLGDAACFSFFPTKNLGCFGDGGLITTNDDDLAIICRAMREHGSGKNGALAAKAMGQSVELLDVEQGDLLYNPYKYFNYLIGCNSRLDAVQAAVLNVKLSYLDSWNKKRAEHAEYYTKALIGSAYRTPTVFEDRKHCFHQYALRTDHKDALADFLAENGIASGAFYPVPLHLQKVFEGPGYQKGAFPVAEKICAQTVCLPIFPELTEEEQDYIIDILKKFKG